MERERRKMQSVSFRNVGEMLAYLPEDELVMVEHLRELVLETIPGLTEKLSFNVPFFSGNRALCFIWPGSIPWGSKTTAGVEFGFNQANLLIDERNYLHKGKRNQVFSRRFYFPEEIDDQILRELLLQADEIDGMFRQY